jgi:hypothetical protein
MRFSKVTAPTGPEYSWGYGGNLKLTTLVRLNYDFQDFMKFHGMDLLRYIPGPLFSKLIQGLASPK